MDVQLDSQILVPMLLHHAPSIHFQHSSTADEVIQMLCKHLTSYHNQSSVQEGIQKNSNQLYNLRFFYLRKVWGCQAVSQSLSLEAKRKRD